MKLLVDGPREHVAMVLLACAQMPAARHRYAWHSGRTGGVGHSTTGKWWQYVDGCRVRDDLGAAVPGAVHQQ